MISYIEFLKNLKEFEGLRLKAYKCPSGVLTIGYGHTHGVVSNMEITSSIAERLLSADIDIVYCQLASLFRNSKIGDCNIGLFYALVDFVFNVGFTKFKNSTLKKLLDTIDLSKPLSQNHKDMLQLQFLRWTKSNGKSLKGLEKRRSWEVSLFYND